MRNDKFSKGNILLYSKELGQRMKSGLVRTKQKVDDLTDDGQVTAEEYANDRMQEMGGSAAEHM